MRLSAAELLSCLLVCMSPLAVTTEIQLGKLVSTQPDKCHFEGQLLLKLTAQGHRPVYLRLKWEKAGLIANMIIINNIIQYNYNQSSLFPLQPQIDCLFSRLATPQKEAY